MVKYDVVLIDAATMQDMPTLVLEATEEYSPHLDHDGMKYFLESQGVGVGDNLIRSVTLHKGRYIYAARLSNGKGLSVMGMVRTENPIHTYDKPFTLIIDDFNATTFTDKKGDFTAVESLVYLHREFNE